MGILLGLLKIVFVIILIVIFLLVVAVFAAVLESGKQWKRERKDPIDYEL